MHFLNSVKSHWATPLLLLLLLIIALFGVFMINFSYTNSAIVIAGLNGTMLLLEIFELLFGDIALVKVFDSAVILWDLNHIFYFAMFLFSLHN